MKDMMPEYIDELESYDKDMLEHNLSRKAVDYKASNPMGAVQIVGCLVDKTLKKLGVEIAPGDSEETISQKLGSKNVKVERRDQYEGEDVWRRGIYIYKGMDLAGFVSEPVWSRPSPLAIDRDPSIVVRAVV